VYLDPASVRARYPDEWLADFQEGGLAITLQVGDLEVAARETGGIVSDVEARVSVPPSRASGVILNFIA
jgi:hypothetical protein